jgi:regulator of replication initiation timing
MSIVSWQLDLYRELRALQERVNELQDENDRLRAWYEALTTGLASGEMHLDDFGGESQPGRLPF